MSIQSVTTPALPISPMAAATSAVANASLLAHGSSAGKASMIEAVSPNPVPPTDATTQREKLETAVKAVKEFIQPMTGSLEFTLDEESGETVIKITDPSTKELIRQIPSKEMLEIAQALDRLQGLLVKQMA